jgi:hypothetical protein
MISRKNKYKYMMENRRNLRGSHNYENSLVKSRVKEFPVEGSDAALVNGLAEDTEIPRDGT